MLTQLPSLCDLKHMPNLFELQLPVFKMGLHPCTPHNQTEWHSEGKAFGRVPGTCRSPLLSKASLFAISVSQGRLRSENIKQKIPGIDNS